MRYATLGGGKRVRALLTYAAGELGQAPAGARWRAAAAVEMIHAYSLVHDDLPHGRRRAASRQGHLPCGV